MIDELTLPLVLGAAAVDSINPCAIGVILFLSSVLMRASVEKRRLLYLGAIYITTVYVVYMLSGLGLVWFQYALITRGYAEVVGIVVGVFVIGLGLIELKDFFWYGKWVSLEIPARYKERLERMAGQITFFSIIVIGAFVAIVELPCTGGPYLAITAILARSFDLGALLYLALYNFVFVVPLVVIVLMIYWGASTSRLKLWRQKNRKWMNLASGVLMLVLGSLLISYYRLDWQL